MHYRSVKEMVEATQNEILQAEANLKKDYDEKQKIKKRIKIILLIILILITLLRLILGPFVINYHSSDFINNKLHIVSVNNMNVMSSSNELHRITIIPWFLYVDIISSNFYDTEYVNVLNNDSLTEEEIIIPEEFLLDQTEELVLPINSEIIIDLKEYECYLMYEGKEYAAHCSKNTINNSKFLETNKYKIVIFKNKEKIYNIDYTSDLTLYLKEVGDYKIIIYSKYNKDYFETTFDIKIK